MPVNQEAFLAKLEKEDIESIRLKRASGAYGADKAVLVDYWLAKKAEEAKPKPAPWHKELFKETAPQVIGALIVAAVIGLSSYLFRSCSPARDQLGSNLSPQTERAESQQASLPPNKPGLIDK